MRVVISGWNNGMNKVQLNHALREHAGFGLADAKTAVDQLLEGKEIVLSIDGRDAATSLCESLSLAGAVFSIEE